MAQRLIPHIIFWIFWFYVPFLQQALPPKELYLYWVAVLPITMAVVYFNLYKLLPTFYFKQKYRNYVLYLLFLCVVGAVFLWYVLQNSHLYLSQMSIQKHFINLIFFVVLTSLFKFYKEYYRKKKLLVITQTQQLQTENALLKAQINPHFLFNTLNNLYGLILQNQNLQAAEITLKLSDLMRYVLESSKNEKVNLKKEIQFLEDYLALEKIRLSQQADIRLEISGIENDIFVAPLLFIPLVENAFKHGLQSIAANSFAHFSLFIQGKELYFEAQNSVGKNLQKIKSGTGLENLRKRLELMYPEKHFLEVEEKESIFKVILHINI